MPSRPPRRNITVVASIIINKDTQSVFDYVSDLRLDRHWRREINETNVATPGLNSIAVESSFLSKRVRSNKANLRCIVYEPGNIVIHQTTPGDWFYQRNSRQVAATPDGATKLTYELEFDTSIVKFGIGIRLPIFVVRYYTTKKMNSYLGRLKRILESER